MPLRYEPRVTHLFANVSFFYLRYGPWPRNMSVPVMSAFSATAVLFACVALYDALRSTRMKHVGLWFVIPLGLLALPNLYHAAMYSLGAGNITQDEVIAEQYYFQPEFLVERIWQLQTTVPSSVHDVKEIVVELVKWGLVFAIAIWLSIAQIRASLPLKRQGRLSQPGVSK